MRLNQTIRNIRRVSDVIKVFVKYGFEEIVTTTALKKFIPRKKKLTWIRYNKSVFEYSTWERIRMVIEELGPTFVKGAQMLSNRPDVLPAELILEFEKLQDQVPPVDYEEIQKILEKSLESPIDEVFDYFDKKPLGSASIGQVHRGRLLNGKDVAIKIQRPGVYETVQTDLSLIRDIIKLTEGYFKKYGILNPLEIVSAFEKSINKELDYNVEARNMEQFQKFYEKDSAFKVPKVYKELSTRMVLVQEFVSGCKITDTEQQEEWGINTKRVAEKGLDIYLHQIFEKGYFHADPHPGNILVRADGAIVLLDYGMIGKLSKRDKFAFSGIFISMANKDARQMAVSLKKLCINSDIPNMSALEYELEELIEDYAYLDVEDMNMKDLTARLYRIIYDYQLTIPGSVFLILRTLVILEGIGKRIHPKFNTFEFVAPYGAKIMKEQYSIHNLTQDFLYSSQQFISLLNSLPVTLKDILINLRKGDLTIKVRNSSNEYLADKIDLASNRIVLGLLVCTLLVLGSVFLITGVSPVHILGMPLFTWTSWILAFFLGFLLFIQMMKNGK